MTIFQSSFHTTACAGTRYAQIEKELLDALLRGNLPRVHRLESPAIHEQLVIYEVNGMPTQEGISYFNHPITLQLPKHMADGMKMQNATFIDSRSLGRWVGADFRIQDYSNYLMLVLRAALNHVFVMGSPSSLKDLSTFPATAYGKFFSQTLTRTFMLEPSQEVVLNVIATYFYFCLFYDDHVLQEEDKDKIIAQTSRATSVPADRCYSFLGDVGMIHDLEELANVIKQQLNSVRLHSFTFGTILQHLCGNWMGNSSREMVGVALEHPPTWIAMIYGGIDEATFKRTQLGKIIDTQARVRSEVPEQFVRNVHNLTGFGDIKKDLMTR